MFGFSYSWFAGQGGLKISRTKIQTLPNLRLLITPEQNWTRSSPPGHLGWKNTIFTPIPPTSHPKSILKHFFLKRVHPRVTHHKSVLNNFSIEHWVYLMVKGVVKKGWRLGLLEGERGNEEKVEIWLTLRWKEHWRKVKDWDYWRVKGAMEKGWRFWLLNRSKEHWSKIENWGY